MVGVSEIINFAGVTLDGLAVTPAETGICGDCGMEWVVPLNTVVTVETG